MHLRDYVQYSRDRAAALLRARASALIRPNPETFLVHGVDQGPPGIERTSPPEWIVDAREFDGQKSPRAGEEPPGRRA